MNDSFNPQVRITSENANNGFKPTAGRIDELVFKPTPEVRLNVTGPAAAVMRSAAAFMRSAAAAQL